MVFNCCYSRTTSRFSVYFEMLFSSSSLQRVVIWAILASLAILLWPWSSTRCFHPKLTGFIWVPPPQDSVQNLQSIQPKNPRRSAVFSATNNQLGNNNNARVTITENTFLKLKLNLFHYTAAPCLDNNMNEQGYRFLLKCSEDYLTYGDKLKTV